jgi:hypothetical protein
VSNWIESSLRNAVLALTRSGEVDIAADLGRLLEEPEVQSLQLLRLRQAAELADRLYDCEDLDELAGLLDAVCATFAVAHCTIHRVRERHIGAYGTRVLSNYPKEWIAEYVNRRYVGVDPVVARALQGTGTFFWEEAVRDDPITAGFLRAASEHGVGPAGITHVAENAAGDTFAVSLSLPISHGTFRHIFDPKLLDFHEIAKLLVEVFSDLTCSYVSGGHALTDDQLKILKALVSGRSPAEVEALPVSYGSFATLEKSILQSLNAKSLFQAVARAAQLRLLETVPLGEEDVYLPDSRSRAA